MGAGTCIEQGQRGVDGGSIRCGQDSRWSVIGVGQPEDLAYLVAFLASDKAKHITGEVIKVDGGQYI